LLQYRTLDRCGSWTWAAGRDRIFAYLSTRLPEPQDWLAVDRDPDLLTPALPSRTAACHIEALCRNLGAPDDPPSPVRRPPSGDGLGACSTWFQTPGCALAGRCRIGGAVALFA
jgi:hypothetical protein